MQVRRHQHIGMYGDLELPGPVFQATQKQFVISRVAEYQLSVIPALDDMMRLIGDDESGKPGHSLNKAE